MARPRIIVGIGEAIIGEYPDRERPDGLAVAIPLAASRLGCTGVAVSRIGQDRAGSTLRSYLREHGVDVSHLQSDPDYATGRIVVRSIAGRVRQTLDSFAAFDRLQWDFDLADLAQQADAVVFGGVARRFGQAQTTIDRFLAECTSAIRVFDVTNRPPGEVNLSSIVAGLANCDGIVLDSSAADAIVPGASARPTARTLEEVMGRHDLAFAALCGEDGSMVAQSGEGTAASSTAGAGDSRSIAVTAMVYGLISGWTVSQCIEQVDRIVPFARSNRDERIPADLLMRGH